MKKQDHLFMEILGAPAWQLYVSLSRKRQTHTHMNTQTLSLSGEEEEFIWTLGKQINFCLAHTLQLPGMNKLNGRKVQKSSQMRQLVMKDGICRQEMCNTAALVLLRLVVCGDTKETPRRMKQRKILSEGENCFKFQT